MLWRAWLALDPNLRGITCVVAGMLIFTAQDAAIKYMSVTYPLHEIVFGRSIVAVALTLLAARLTLGWRALRTTRPLWHVFRATLLVTMNLCYFVALASMPIAEAAGIFFVAPLLITVLSVPVLGERLGARRTTAVVVGFAGMLMIVRPGSGVFESVALLPLLAAVAYASMQLSTRFMGRTETALVMAFYAQCTFIVVSLGFGVVAGDGSYLDSPHPSAAFLLRAWVVPDTEGVLLMLGCGLSVGVGALLLSEAYRIAAPATLSPFEYVALPAAIVWGFIVFGQLPDRLAFVGIALIGTSGLYVFFRERHLARLRADSDASA
ncbi:MAG: DMT family transporter [Pseudomonadota bacterium]